MERKLAAIFSTDVKDYSRLMSDDEEATIQTLKTYREVITSLIEQHRGRVVDSPGDNMLAEFASAVDAVKAAVAIQQELKIRNTELEAHRQMKFRIGLNVGDVITDEDRLYGEGVNIAARLEGLAEPGGICLSGTVYDQIANKLDVPCAYQGEQAVKNIAKPVRAYKAVFESDGTSLPPTVSQEQRERSPREEPHPALRWPLAVFIGIAALMVGSSILVFRNFLSQPSRLSLKEPLEEVSALPLPDKPSIAVLPFTNISGDPEQEYFSDGMTEDLITDLSKISGLLVIARHSTFTYKGKTVNIGEVSRKLGVRYVLEGSTRRAGDRVRINAQLVDATTGGHLWAERYDRALTDIFTLQDEVTQLIVTALKVALTKGEQEQLRHRNTDNLEAYDYMLRGRTYYYRYTKEANTQARRMFARAIELDAEYADAYAWLGFTHWIDMVSQWSETPAHALERFEELAHRALSLDASLPMAHLAMGYIYLWRDHQYDRAITELQEAVTLAPNDAHYYWTLAEGLNFAARHAEALEPIQQAIRLNPHYPAPYAMNLGWAYQHTGQKELALTAYKKAVNLNPDFLGARLQLISLYTEFGQEKEARAEAAEVLRITPNFSAEEFGKTNPYANRTELERFVAELRQLGLK